MRIKNKTTVREQHFRI